MIEAYGRFRGVTTSRPGGIGWGPTVCCPAPQPLHSPAKSGEWSVLDAEGSLFLSRWGAANLQLVVARAWETDREVGDCLSTARGGLWQRDPTPPCRLSQVPLPPCPYCALPLGRSPASSAWRGRLQAGHTSFSNSGSGSSLPNTPSMCGMPAKRIKEMQEARW